MIKVIEKPVLPAEIDGAKVPEVLLSQAVRVFLANQRQGNQSALTRAEVNRTRKKVFKQKGTGHARHGDRKAPLFVGGGIAFAPKPRDHSLNLPSKMVQMAKNGAMALKVKEGNLVVVSGLKDTGGKTAVVAKFLTGLSKEPAKVLLVTDGSEKNVHRAARNIADCEVSSWSLVSTYQIVWADKVVVMEEAFLSKVNEGNKDNNQEIEKKIISKKEVIKKTVVKKAVKAKK